MPSLSGVKVVDLSRLLPGPYATLVLADMGAEVIKVENPDGGDEMRQLPPFLPNGNSALFEALNRNKRSVAIDLKSLSGVQHFKDLVRSADVLVESFRPGVMQRLGLDFPSLSEFSPKLIYCSISGYGQTGPDAKRAGHDINFIARSGVLGYGGEKDGPPALPAAQIADVGGGLFAVTGILAALYERERTGKGQFIDVSMTESAMAFIHMHLAARLLTGPEGTPLSRGTDLLNGGVPNYATYRTSDGRYLAVGALEPKFFKALSEALNLEELDRDVLKKVFEAHPLEYWKNFFAELDVCVEPVLEGDEVFSDAQFTARGIVVKSDGVPVLRTPMASGGVSYRRAPALDEFK